MQATRRVVIVAVLAALGAVLVAGPTMARTVSPVVTLVANRTGRQKAPGPGDRNGSGDAKLIVAKAKVCYVPRGDDTRRPSAPVFTTGQLSR